jgi:hypothetical protein
MPGFALKTLDKTRIDPQKDGNLHVGGSSSTDNADTFAPTELHRSAAHRIQHAKYCLCFHKFDNSGQNAIDVK